MFIIISAILVLILVVADQLIKVWAIDSLQPTGTMPFIHFGDFKVLDLTYLENNGAVFGSFGGMRWILIIVTTLLIAVCGYFLYKYKTSSKIMFISLNLIIAGGIGNWIDRVFRGGKVVDYIEVKLFNFAIFNFADICVTVGVALILIYVLFIEKHTEKKQEVSVNAD